MMILHFLNIYIIYIYIFVFSFRCSYLHSTIFYNFILPWFIITFSWCHWSIVLMMMYGWTHHLKLFRTVIALIIDFESFLNMIVLALWPWGGSVHTETLCVPVSCIQRAAICQARLLATATLDSLFGPESPATCRSCQIEWVGVGVRIESWKLKAGTEHVEFELEHAKSCHSCSATKAVLPTRTRQRFRKPLVVLWSYMIWTRPCLVLDIPSHKGFWTLTLPVCEIDILTPHWESSLNNLQLGSLLYLKCFKFPTRALMFAASWSGLQLSDMCLAKFQSFTSFKQPLLLYHCLFLLLWLDHGHNISSFWHLERWIESTSKQSIKVKWKLKG